MEVKQESLNGEFKYPRIDALNVQARLLFSATRNVAQTNYINQGHWYWWY